MMILHSEIDDADLRNFIRKEKIVLGSNRKLKIYGTLKCSSGKRMKRENRVFFSSEEDALNKGYRPCGHCLKQKYLAWKHGFV